MEPDPEPNRKWSFDAVSDIEIAARILLNNGVVVYPTETFYGIFAGVFSLSALKTISKLKNRDTGAALPAVVGDGSDLSRLTNRINQRHKILMETYWPGPLTLVFDARPDIPEIVTGRTGSIGIRLPGLLSTRRLAQLAGPLVATSANFRGESPLRDPLEIKSRFGAIPLFGRGVLSKSAGSTILDVRLEEPVLIRKGDISVKDLEQTLGTTIKKGL